MTRLVRVAGSRSALEGDSRLGQVVVYPLAREVVNQSAPVAAYLLPRAEAWQSIATDLAAWIPGRCNLSHLLSAGHADNNVRKP